MIRVKTKTILGDLTTPIGVYLRIRRVYRECILFENSDRNNLENSYSYIAFDSIAHIKMMNGLVEMQYPDKQTEQVELENCDLNEVLNTFIGKFDNPSFDSLPVNGFFGYSNYDSFRYFSKHKKENQHISKDANSIVVPDMYFILYRFIIIFNDFQNNLTIIENIPTGTSSKMEETINFLSDLQPVYDNFRVKGNELSDVSDQEFSSMILQAKENCKDKQLKKVVLARQFYKKYHGDDFNVYRSLRTLNPSSLIFYFHFDLFTILGASPIGWCSVNENKVSLENIRSFKRNKIAGGVNNILLNSIENSEHYNQMNLLQLELEKISTDIEIDYFRKLQFYSQRVRLISKISATLREDKMNYSSVFEVFPAYGTAGIPKTKAMETIGLIEKSKRNIYGSTIGYIGFNRKLHLTINRINFLSINESLYYHANISINEGSSPSISMKEADDRLDFIHEIIEKAQQLN